MEYARSLHKKFSTNSRSFSIFSLHPPISECVMLILVQGQDSFIALYINFTCNTYLVRGQDSLGVCLRTQVTLSMPMSRSHMFSLQRHSASLQHVRVILQHVTSMLGFSSTCIMVTTHIRVDFRWQRYFRTFILSNGLSD